MQEDFRVMVRQGFEVEDDQFPDLVHKVLIEVHEIKN